MSRMVTGQEPAHVAAFGNYRDANDDGRIDTSIAGICSAFPAAETTSSGWQNTLGLLASVRPAWAAQPNRTAASS